MLDDYVRNCETTEIALRDQLTEEDFRHVEDITIDWSSGVWSRQDGFSFTATVDVYEEPEPSETGVCNNCGYSLLKISDVWVHEHTRSRPCSVQFAVPREQ